MVQLQTVSGLPVTSLVKISTVVGTVVSILGVCFAGQAVVLITKYPASWRHGDLVHEDATMLGTAVVVVVVANVVRTVSEGLSSLSFSRWTEPGTVSTVSAFSETYVTVSSIQFTELVVPLAVWESAACTATLSLFTLAALPVRSAVAVGVGTLWPPPDLFVLTAATAVTPLRVADTRLCACPPAPKVLV